MKTIIEMAGKAFETPGVEPAFRNGFWTVTSEELERFFHMAQAAEREACANLCEDLYKKWVNELVADTDEEEDPPPPDWLDCKLAIAARGNT
jgi:hypothetical protein